MLVDDFICDTVKLREPAKASKHQSSVETRLEAGVMT